MYDLLGHRAPACAGATSERPRLRGGSAPHFCHSSLSGIPPDSMRRNPNEIPDKLE